MTGSAPRRTLAVGHFPPKVSLVAYDPGRRGGLALFGDQGDLCYIAEGGPEQLGDLCEAVRPWLSARARFVFERQEYRPRGASKGSPNLVLQHNATAGYLAGLLGLRRPQGFRPAQWKGTVPASILPDRCRKNAGLSPAESFVFEGANPAPRGFHDDGQDAAMLGLFALGRLDIAATAPRT